MKEGKGKHRKPKLSRKARRATGQCRRCLNDRHHYGRVVRGCTCGCVNVNPRSAGT